MPLYRASSAVRSNLSEYARHVRMFSRNARLYLIGSFLIATNFAVFNLLFNLYLREFGFPEGDVGLLQSARAFGSALVAIPAALLISRVRLKPILIAATTLFALFSLGLLATLEIKWLVSFASLAGMSFAFYRVASGPFFMRNSTEVERTHLFSFSFAMVLLAGMVGSSGSGNLVTYIGDVTGDISLGYKYTMFLGIMLGLVAMVPFAMIHSAKPSASENRISFSFDQLKRRGSFYFKITSANFLIGLGAGLTIPFLNIFFRDRFDLPPDQIGWYFFAVSCSMFLGTLSGPLFTRKFGLIRTIVLTQFISIPFMFVLANSTYLPLVVVAFVLRGGFMNLGVPISTNFGMVMSEKKEQGLVNALLMVSWTSGQAVSASIGGEVIEAYGYTVSINMSIVLYIASAIIYYWYFRNSEKKNSDQPGWHIPARGEL